MTRVREVDCADGTWHLEIGDVVPEQLRQVPNLETVFIRILGPSGKEYNVQWPPSFVDSSSGLLCQALRRLKWPEEQEEAERKLREQFIRDHGFSGSYVYRFTDKKEYVDQLLRGDVWIGTLQTYRDSEEKGRADPGEAILRYDSGIYEGDATDPETQRRLEQMGIRTASGHVHVRDNVAVRRIQDAYVLCFTARFAPAEMATHFGGYCVRIAQPLEFLRRLTICITARGLPIEHAILGRVKYASREYREGQTIPGTVGFVKPPDAYESQQEVRMVWTVRDGHLPKAQSIPCPSVTDLCERIA